MRFLFLCCAATLSFALSLANFTPLALSSAAFGQDDTNKNDVQVNVFRTGVGVFDEGEWTVIGLRGVNRRPTDVKATVVLYFDKDTQTQYKRTFWLPARSQRMTWMPVRTPETLAKKNSLSAFTMNIIEGEDGADSAGDVRRGADASLFTETLLPVNSLATHTGIIQAIPDPTRPGDNSWTDPAVSDVVGSMREAFKAAPATVDFRDVFLPPYPHSFDSLDNLVISDDRWLNDSAAPIAIRSWIARGGKVWLMLDKVSQRSVNALLGDDACCEVVDRVELTEFTLNTPQLAYADIEPLERWESERPVDFVRTLLSDNAVVHTSIGQWPAAFSVRQGSGEVLITTLGARGWHHHVADLEDPPGKDVAATGHTNALEDIGSRMLAQPPESRLSAEGINPMLQSQIGYEVPSRGMVGLLLGANCLLLIGVGFALARVNKLEHIAWILPVCCLLTAGVMVAIGVSNVSKVPATLASMQLLEVASGSEQVQATTYATIYSPKSDEFPLSVDHGGLVVSEDSGLEGSSKRVSWDGVHHSYQEAFQLPPGAVRAISIRDNYILPQSVRVTGHFDSEGFMGRLHGFDADGGSSDAFVAAPISAGSSLAFLDGGNFVCREDQLLAQGEFLTGALLTDQQQRRQTILRSIFKTDSRTPYPSQPTFFMWSDDESLGIEVPSEYQARREALWAIPLGIGRTPSNTQFVVPATFIQMARANGKLGASSVYNPRTGLWLENARSATKSLFRFVLPSQVLPAQISSATITLKIHAPSREVQLLGWNATTNSVVTIQRWQSPSGVSKIEVTDADLLQVTSDQALLLGISVSDVNGDASKGAKVSSGESAPASTWKASYMRVSVAGTTK